MLNLSSPFSICTFPLSIYGEFEIIPERYENSRLIREMSEIVGSYVDTNHKAYEINGRITTSNDNLLSCELTPLDSTLGNYGAEFFMVKDKFIRLLLEQLSLHKKTFGIWINNTRESHKVYVMQILKEKFDPYTTELLLAAIESAILTPMEKRHNIEYQINENVLKVDAEILSKDSL